jgi:hypothetical protein
MQKIRNDRNHKIKIWTRRLLLIAGTVGMGTQAKAAGICEARPATVWSSGLSSSTYAFTRGYNGTWAVTSGGYTVSGISQCNGSSTSNPSSTTDAEGVNCWCRMTSPVVGSSWVNLNDVSNGGFCNFDCSKNCANCCADCVRNSQNGSCTRSAVLVSS